MKIYIPSYRRPDTPLIQWAVNNPNVIVCLNSNNDVKYPEGLNIITGGTSIIENRNIINKHFLEHSSDPLDMMVQIDDNTKVFRVCTEDYREKNVDISFFYKEFEKDALLAQSLGFELLTPEVPGFLNFWARNLPKPIPLKDFLKRSPGLSVQGILASRRAIEAIGDYKQNSWENVDWWVRGAIKGFKGVATRRCMATKGQDTSKYVSYVYDVNGVSGNGRIKKQLEFGQRFEKDYPGLKVRPQDHKSPGYPFFTYKQLDNWIKSYKRGFFNLNS